MTNERERYYQHQYYLKRRANASILKVCLSCGKSFKTHRPSAKYCSRKCMLTYGRIIHQQNCLSRRISKTCPICNVLFSVIPAYENSRIYCSKRCQGIAMMVNPTNFSGIDLKCSKCQRTLPVEFFPIAKQNVNRYGFASWCRSCYSEDQKHRKEERNSRAAARRLLFSHDPNKICVKCGGTEKVETHHKDGNVFNNVIENLEWCCDPCHSIEHRKLNQEFRKLNPKSCSVCKEIKPLYSRYNKCKECFNKYQREYQKNRYWNVPGVREAMAIRDRKKYLKNKEKKNG
jgi:endogenous inhibitor of DNA gyrase (YacG/DUF329 family)